MVKEGGGPPFLSREDQVSASNGDTSGREPDRKGTGQFRKIRMERTRTRGPVELEASLVMSTETEVKPREGFRLFCSLLP